MFNKEEPKPKSTVLELPGLHKIHITYGEAEEPNKLLPSGEYIGHAAGVRLRDSSIETQWYVSEGQIKMSPPIRQHTGEGGGKVLRWALGVNKNKREKCREKYYFR